MIWNRALPHGSGRNRTDRLRLSQYLTMFPTPPPEQREQRAALRVKLWRERLNPPQACFPGDPRRLEQREGKTAELTLLGKKLLGIDSW